MMHPQVKNYIFKLLSQKRIQEEPITQNSQKMMNPTSSPNKSPNGQQQLMCQKHSNSNIKFICSVQNCKQNRKICQLCKQRQSLHISHHSNYIFKLKEFFDFNQSKLVIPKLQKGLQDLEGFIAKHKQFYKQQIRKITQDFDQLINKFIETSNQYKKVYIQNFEKQINAFDNQFMDIVNNLKAYSNQKSHRQSFFTKLFGNDKNPNDIQDLIQKNLKGFQVRACIMTLKSKVSSSKVGKTRYKNSENSQNKFNQLLGYLESFCASFYDKFKDLLVSNNQNVASSPEKNNLKSSIVSETKSLSISRVNSLTFDDVTNLKMSLVLDKQLIKCPLPQPHPKVIGIKKFLKPFPNFTRSNLKEEGPFKYQTGTYLGNYEKGVRSGKGIFIFDDGSYYQGSWQNDNMSGYGRLIKPNSYYEGDIIDGFAHGKGNLEDYQKTYSGEWRNDLRHGLGQEEFKNKKRKYIGTFVNDKYEGRGKLVDQQFIYEGQFKAGLFDGEGLIKYKNGETFKGASKQNQRIFGRHTFPDGSYFQGTFRDNMPHGSGQFYWPDGTKYSGQWRSGLEQGIGIQTLANGKQLKGFWQNGVWLKWI